LLVCDTSEKAIDAKKKVLEYLKTQPDDVKHIKFVSSPVVTRWTLDGHLAEDLPEHVEICVVDEYPSSFIGGDLFFRAFDGIITLTASPLLDSMGEGLEPPIIAPARAFKSGRVPESVDFDIQNLPCESLEGSGVIVQAFVDLATAWSHQRHRFASWLLQQRLVRVSRLHPSPPALLSAYRSLLDPVYSYCIGITNIVYALREAVVCEGGERAPDPAADPTADPSLDPTADSISLRLARARKQHSTLPGDHTSSSHIGERTLEAVEMEMLGLVPIRQLIRSEQSPAPPLTRVERGLARTELLTLSTLSTYVLLPL
jgi:hypothetical protein